MGLKKITSLDTIEFFDTHVCINNPDWQSNGIAIFLFKYYIVISDALVGSFLDVLCLLLAVILSELSKNLRRNKDWVHRRICLRDITFLTTRLPFFVIFCCFFCLLPPPSQVTYFLNDSIYHISMGGILCGDIMSERSKIRKSLAI